MAVEYPDSDDVPTYRDLLQLRDYGAMVIGAGQGMGRQTCHALAQCGAKVLCVDRDPELARTIANEINGIPFAGDATNRGDVEAAFDMGSKEFGAMFKAVVDIVGFAHLRPFSEMDDKTWDAQFNIVVRHAFLAIQIGAPDTGRIRWRSHDIYWLTLRRDPSGQPKRIRGGQGGATSPRSDLGS